MHKKARQFVFIFSLLLSLPAFSGCVPLLVGAAVGAGGYAWVRGAIVKQFDIPTAKLHAAALRALKDLKLPVRYDKADRITATIRSEFSDGKNISIDIRAVTEYSARITIRVGFFDDRLRSEMILDALQKTF